MLKVKRLVLLVSIMLLAACGSGVVGASGEVQIFSGGKARDYSVLTDNETGCEYIEAYHYVHSGVGVSITPRLDAEGGPICGKD